MEYVARVSIVHSRQDRPNGLSPEAVVIIAAGSTFDPDAIGVPPSEVLRLLARGHIAAPAQPEEVRQVVTGQEQSRVKVKGINEHRTDVFDAVDRAIARDRQSS